MINQSVTHPAPTTPTARRVDLRTTIIVGMAVLAWLVQSGLNSRLVYAISGLPW